MALDVLSACAIFILSWVGVTSAQGDATLWTSWIPLAVRSPYLSCWMNTTNVPFNAGSVDGTLRASSVWPQFLEGQELEWTGLIRIDNNQTYIWLGDPDAPTGFNRSILNNIQITPTRTIMNITAGPLDLTVTFLSPIEPSNLALQSLPFSYVALEAKSNDGQEHAVQVYSDISGEWLTGNRTDFMNFTWQATNTIVYHQLELETPRLLSENTNQAEDATVFYGMSSMPSQTYRTGLDAICRADFQQSAALTVGVFDGPRIITNPVTVFAIAVDIGNVLTTSSPVVWAVGMTRNPAIGYIGPDGTEQQRSPYWASQYSAPPDAVTTFITDYPNALNRAITLDQKILTDAANVSAHYADLVSLAARQAMGGIELTIGRNTSDASQFNTSDVKMFMKDLGTSGRVNPVEGLYSAFPFFLYINPAYCGYLLDPVLEFSDSSRWAYPYAPRDLGLNYPNATGNTTAHTEGVEQSGNMLIMSLAHARATGDDSLISQYYQLLRGWADYLVNNSLPLSVPQTSPDSTDTIGNLTNLALKGIIGIKAMSEISVMLNIDDDIQHYANISSVLSAAWQAQALSTDHQHILTSFGDLDSSWAITYNLFADQLLKTNIIDSSLYNSETAFLKTMISNSTGGLPINTGLIGEANTAFSLLTAAYVDDPAVLQGLVDEIWGRASSNASDTGIFPTFYALQGSALNNMASPLIGGVFAPLSLFANATVGPANSTSSSSPAGTTGSTGSSSGSPTSKKSSHIGAIVGGVVGGIGGATVILILVGFFRGSLEKRKQRPVTEPAPFPHQSLSDPAPELMSSKAREAALSPRQALQPAGTPPQSTASSSSDQTSSVGMPDDVIVLGPDPVVNAVRESDVRGLRTEMENLRRVVETLQEARYEPPPSYAPGSDT